MNELFHFATVRNCQNTICIWDTSNKTYLHLDFDLLMSWYSKLKYNLGMRVKGHNVSMYNLFPV